MAKVDFRKQLTDRMVGFMEEHDGLPWQKGWEAVNVRPFNPGNGVKYKGGNVLNLMYAAIERDTDDSRWMTLKQANAAGYSIAKGAKGASVEYWDWGQQKERKRELDAAGKPVEGAVADSDDAEEKRRSRPLVFHATVFNGADIVGLPEFKREVKWKPNDLAEKLIAATGVQIEHRALSKTAGGRAFENAAYYDNRSDKIILPPRASFKSDADYYATKLHELGHSTGHKSRLDRGLSEIERGSPEYAKEELRAEIASMLLTSMLGIEGNVQNHARYASHWIEVLKNDKHELFRAAKDAELIVDHIFDYAPELKAIVDSRLVDNLLPKEAPRRKRYDETVELPNFIPAEAAKPVGVGRDDPRWASFESAVRGEAKKYGITDGTVEATFDLLVPQFSDVMDAADRNGYSVDDMNTMLVRQLVEEMRSNKEREQQWEKFASQVRIAADGLMTPERVELELQKVHQKYQRALQEAGQNGLDNEQTDSAVRAVIFGEEGRRPVSPEFIKERFLDPKTVVADVEPDADPDDDLLLVPGGGSLMLGDAMPGDASAVPDERIGGHAEQHEMNTVTP